MNVRPHLVQLFMLPVPPSECKAELTFRCVSQWCRYSAVPSVPVVCPMQGAYSFNYNDLTFGFCARPASYARPCSNGTIYQLQFRHCVTEASLSGTGKRNRCLVLVLSWLLWRSQSVS